MIEPTTCCRQVSPAQGTPLPPCPCPHDAARSYPSSCGFGWRRYICGLDLDASRASSIILARACKKCLSPLVFLVWYETPGERFQLYELSLSNLSRRTCMFKAALQRVCRLSCPCTTCSARHTGKCLQWVSCRTDVIQAATTMPVFMIPSCITSPLYSPTDFATCIENNLHEYQRDA